MKIHSVYFSLAFVLCLFIVPHTQAQNVWGYSSISYDDSTGYVTVSSTTELDYAVQEYYKARVISKLKDGNGTTLALAAATESFDDGYITVTYGTYNSSAEEFEVVATHLGVATLRDASLNKYWDYFNYVWWQDFNVDSFLSYGFLGAGPPLLSNSSILQVGQTHSYAHKSLARVLLSLSNENHITPFPEFSGYYSSVAAEGGIDWLGPLPMGQGRSDAPGEAYTFATLMTGLVNSPSYYNSTFRWKRLITRRSWYIKYNSGTNSWLVTQRSSRGTTAPDDDTGVSDFYDASPSSLGKIYFFDNSALGPNDFSGSSLGIGDYIREEKAFTYLVDYFNGTSWVRVGRMNMGQILTVRRYGTTGVVTSDWEGKENSVAARRLDAVIKQNEVRNVVGGSAPISIDSSANN
jgi:hypothetical protein